MAGINAAWPRLARRLPQSFKPPPGRSHGAGRANKQCRGETATRNQIYNPLGNAALSTIAAASTATNWYGHEGSILRYVFWHSVVFACLVGVLVTLQAYVYPFTEIVLK